MLKRLIFTALAATLLASCQEQNVLPVAPKAGLRTIESSGEERQYYVRLPSDYTANGAPKPLIFAFHGTTGSYEFWLNGFYDLVDEVGDGAIFVLMQAKVDATGVTQWDDEVDFQYFEDVLAEVSADITWDRNRLFITGHSAGGGMSHEVGCRYGDIVRAIAPHAGIKRSLECTGAVAVLQTHGRNDGLVPWGAGEGGHQFWVAYNGFEYEVSSQVLHPSCIDHSLGGSPYPVIWCLHDEGEGVAAHDWPSFGSALTWAFFRGLDNVAPSPEPPPGGGNDNLEFDTSWTFTLKFPEDMDPIWEGAVGIYPFGTRQPLSAGPDSLINLGFDTLGAQPGDTVTYQVPITYVNEMFPGSYTGVILVYVTTGGKPIPFPGLDHLVLVDLELPDANTPVIIDGVMTLEPVNY